LAWGGIQPAKSGTERVKKQWCLGESTRVQRSKRTDRKNGKRTCQLARYIELGDDAEKAQIKRAISSRGFSREKKEVPLMGGDLPIYRKKSTGSWGTRHGGREQYGRQKKKSHQWLVGGGSKVGSKVRNKK